MLQEVRLAIRLVLSAALPIVGIPFVVSSPGKTAFWIVLGAVTAVTLPGLWVSTYFLADIRRLRRERKSS